MDSGICQTSTASPAEPGGLPLVLATAGRLSPVSCQESAHPCMSSEGRIPLAYRIFSNASPVNGSVPDISMRGLCATVSELASNTPSPMAAPTATMKSRGPGETRMPYKTVSEDDPSLALLDEVQAYVNPLSSVLADYVYNSLLAGRPYFLQMIEDTEIALRFSQETLHASAVSIASDPPSAVLADAIAGNASGREPPLASGNEPYEMVRYRNAAPRAMAHSVFTAGRSVHPIGRLHSHSSI